MHNELPILGYHIPQWLVFQSLLALNGSSLSNMECKQGSKLCLMRIAVNVVWNQCCADSLHWVTKLNLFFKVSVSVHRYLQDTRAMLEHCEGSGIGLEPVQSCNFYLHDIPYMWVSAKYRCNHSIWCSFMLNTALFWAPPVALWDWHFGMCTWESVM